MGSILTKQNPLQSKTYKPKPLTNDPIANEKLDKFITDTLPPIYKQNCVDKHTLENKFRCERIRTTFLEAIILKKTNFAWNAAYECEKLSSEVSESILDEKRIYKKVQDKINGLKFQNELAKLRVELDIE